jgi:hypothetical protein
MLSYCRMIEALDDFVQKAGDNKAQGDRDGNAASAQIEKFVFVDLTGSCAVAAWESNPAITLE